MFFFDAAYCSVMQVQIASSNQLASYRSPSRPVKKPSNSNLYGYHDHLQSPPSSALATVTTHLEVICKGLRPGLPTVSHILVNVLPFNLVPHNHRVTGIVMGRFMHACPPLPCLLPQDHALRKRKSGQMLQLISKLQDYSKGCKSYICLCAKKGR